MKGCRIHVTCNIQDIQYMHNEITNTKISKEKTIYFLISKGLR